MSMRPSPIEPVPEETARIARAAFRKGNLLMRIRDEIGVLYDDQMFASLYDARGQLAIAPWRLALVTLFQFLENLSPSVPMMMRHRPPGSLDLRA